MVCVDLTKSGLQSLFFLFLLPTAKRMHLNFIARFKKKTIQSAKDKTEC